MCRKNKLSDRLHGDLWRSRVSNDLNVCFYGLVKKSVMPLFIFWITQDFPWLAFGSCLLPKSCSEFPELSDKSPDLRIYYQCKLDFIYFWLCILICFEPKGQEI